MPPFTLRLVRDQVAAVIQKEVHNEHLCNMYEYVLKNELGGMGGGGRRHGLKSSRRRMCTDYPSKVELLAKMLAVVINWLKVHFDQWDSKRISFYCSWHK